MPEDTSLDRPGRGSTLDVDGTGAGVCKQRRLISRHLCPLVKLFRGLAFTCRRRNSASFPCSSRYIIVFSAMTCKRGLSLSFQQYFSIMNQASRSLGEFCACSFLLPSAPAIEQGVPLNWLQSTERTVTPASFREMKPDRESRTRWRCQLALFISCS